MFAWIFKTTQVVHVVFEMNTCEISYLFKYKYKRGWPKSIARSTSVRCMELHDRRWCVVASEKKKRKRNIISPRGQCRVNISKFFHLPDLQNNAFSWSAHIEYTSSRKLCSNPLAPLVVLLALGFQTGVYTEPCIELITQWCLVTFRFQRSRKLIFGITNSRYPNAFYNTYINNVKITTPHQKFCLSLAWLVFIIRSWQVGGCEFHGLISLKLTFL